MHAVVVSNKLVVSEDGTRQVVAVDLDTFELSVLRNLKHLKGSLGAITFADGRYYVCQSQKIYSFSEDTEKVKLLASVPKGNIVGVVVTGGRLVVVVNGDELQFCT